MICLLAPNFFCDRANGLYKLGLGIHLPPSQKSKQLPEIRMKLGDYTAQIYRDYNTKTTIIDRIAINQSVFPKDPEPSRSKRIFRVPIPSEKNRNVGLIPFLRHLVSHRRVFDDCNPHITGSFNKSGLENPKAITWKTSCC